MGDRTIGVDLLGDEGDLARALDMVATKLGEVAQKIRETSGDVNIGVEVSNDHADEQLDETKRKRNELDGKDAKFKVNADTSGGIGNLHAMAIAIAALIPLAIAAAGAVAGIGAVGIAGFAAAAAGFSGIGTAVQAMGQKAAAGGAAVKVSADAVRSATEAVAAAQRGYSDALDAVGAAQRSVAAAARDVTAAQDAVARAALNVGTAEHDLARAQADEELAQRSLTDAHAAAEEQLRSLQLQTEDMALSQKDAALSVAEAEANAAKVHNTLGVTDLQNQRADLQVEQAKQRQTDLADQAQQLAAKKADADAKGVEGSDLVTAAQQRIADSQDRVEAATLRVADAQKAQADASQKVLDAVQKEADAQKGLAKAHEDVALARQKIADAQIQLNEAQHPAASGGGGGVDPVAAAMAKLTPAGREFATFLRGFIDGPLKQLADAGQAKFLPGIEAGMKTIEPAMKSIQPAFASFSGILGKALGNLLPILASLAKPFLDFATAALRGLAPLQPVLQTFATQLGNMFEQAAKSGLVQKMMQGLTQIIGALLSLLPPLIDAGMKVMAALGPSLATVVKSLGDAIVAILPSLVKLAPSVAAILVAVAPLLPPLGQLIASVIGLLPPIVALLLPLIEIQVAITTKMIPAFSTAVDWIDNHILPAWNSWNTTATKVHNAVVNGLTSVISFITGAPGKVHAALSSFFSPLETGFKAAMNAVIRGWNSLHFSIPSFSFAGLSIQGFDIGVPPIQYLAKGGVATRPTLAVIGEAGPEAVVPLSQYRGGGSGGGGDVYVTVQVTQPLGSPAAIGSAVSDALRRLGARGIALAVQS